MNSNLHSLELKLSAHREVMPPCDGGRGEGENPYNSPLPGPSGKGATIGTDRRQGIIQGKT